MKKIKIDDKFGKLTVKKDLGKTELYVGKKWLCLCDCGKEKELSSKYLLRGGEKSCGCTIEQSSRIDKVKIGDKFGRLKVIEDLRLFKKNRGYKVICQCKCGNKKETYTFLLLNNKVKSCGCLNKDAKSLPKKRIEINDKFGRLIVKEKRDKGRWYCQCSCGNMKLVNGSLLRTGSTKSCGCLNKEVHSTGHGVITGSFFCDVKISAKNRHLDFNIDIEYLDKLFKKQNGCCAISGLPIVIAPRKQKIQTTASLDRIDSSVGYIQENVQFVHKHINVMKNNYNIDYFLKLCKIISDHNERKL